MDLRRPEPGTARINPNRNLISNIGFGEEATNATADPLGIAGRPLEGITFPSSTRRRCERDEEADRVASHLSGGRAAIGCGVRVLRPAGMAPIRAGADPAEDQTARDPGR